MILFSSHFFVIESFPVRLGTAPGLGVYRESKS